MAAVVWMAELVRSLDDMVEAEGVALPFRRGVAVSFIRLWWTGSYRVPEPEGMWSSRFRRLGAWRVADVFALTVAPFAIALAPLV